MAITANTYTMETPMNGNETVVKGWGKETIFADTDMYCGKFLEFKTAGNKFSMHFHKEKDETWVVLSGSFLLRVIDTKTAQVVDKVMRPGDRWRNPPMMPHQLEALEDNSVIIEVSTEDHSEDNYRVLPGDSQKPPE